MVQNKEALGDKKQFESNYKYMYELYYDYVFIIATGDTIIINGEHPKGAAARHSPEASSRGGPFGTQ